EVWNRAAFSKYFLHRSGGGPDWIDWPERRGKINPAPNSRRPNRTGHWRGRFTKKDPTQLCLPAFRISRGTHSSIYCGKCDAAVGCPRSESYVAHGRNFGTRRFHGL